MALGITTYAIAATLIFMVSFVFAILGLGGGMLYVPIIKWLGFPLNGLNTLLAFLRYWREGLVDFRGGDRTGDGAARCTLRRISSD